MFLVSAVPAIIQGLGFWFIPESPRWLVSKGCIQEGRDILEKVHGKQISREILLTTEDAIIKENGQNTEGRLSFRGIM